MSTFHKNGLTYKQYYKSSPKGRRIECIKHIKGLRNFWERISLKEYTDAKEKGITIPIK